MLFSKITEKLENALTIKNKKLEKCIKSGYFNVTILDLNLFSEHFDDNLKNKSFKIILAPLKLDPHKDFDCNNGFRFQSEGKKILIYASVELLMKLSNKNPLF